MLRANKNETAGAVIHNVLQHISSTCSLVGTRSEVYLNIAIEKKKRLCLGSRPIGRVGNIILQKRARGAISSMAQTDWARVKF